MKPRPIVWVFVGVIGGALLVVGLIGAARGWPAAGLAFIFATLFLLVLLLLTHERIDKFMVGFTRKGVHVDVQLAQQVRDEFTSAGISGLASTYAFVHAQLAEDPTSRSVKVKLQDELVKIAQDNDFRNPIGPPDVERIIKSGSRGERVLLFGLLTANPALANPSVLLEGITNSQSGNEQFHALKAAEASWANLDGSARAQIVDAIEKSPWINPDSDRRNIADRITRLPIG